MEFLGAFLVFIRFGLLCFGGGNALVPIYLEEFVHSPDPVFTSEEFGNLTAISQMTPGPIGINTAAFIGYRSFGGVTGSLGATLGLITPSILMMLFVATHIKNIERNPRLATLMRRVAPASIALMIFAALIFAAMSLWDADASSTVKYLQITRIEPFAILICAATAWAVCTGKVQITLTIVASAAAGALYWGLLAP